MIAIDPDPLPGKRAKRAQISLQWSRPAGRVYSGLSDASTRASLNALIKRVINQTLKQAPFKLLSPEEVEDATFAVEVSLVDDAEMLELNAGYRGKNKPTDVLSFSQLEGDAMPFGGEELLLGDIIISIDTAARQAQELHHSLSHEIAFLTAHGTLHLCGYDHDTSVRRRVMFKLQDEIVQQLEIE
jgi:probable rRNA maturation factor